MPFPPGGGSRIFFDIIVTAGAPMIPKPLMAQLKIGGRLVIPVGDEVQIAEMIAAEIKGGKVRKGHHDGNVGDLVK